MAGIQTARAVEDDEVVAACPWRGEVGVGHAELGLEHMHPRVTGVLEAVQAVLEDGPPGPRPRDVLAPRGSERALPGHGALLD